MKYFLCGLFVVVALACCAGCGARTDAGAQVEEVPEPCSDVLGEESTLSICKIPDGPTCVVYHGYKNGGVSCDWSHKN